VTQVSRGFSDRAAILRALPGALDPFEAYIARACGQYRFDEKRVFTCKSRADLNADLRTMVAADDDYICCKVLGGVDSLDTTRTDGVGLLFRQSTMSLVMELDGSLLTCARTAVVSGIAARRLAPPKAERLLFVGAGRLAPYQIVSMAAAFPTAAMSLYDISRQACTTTVEELRDVFGDTAFELAIETDLPRAAHKADVIVTLTPSRTPLLHLRSLKNPVHINAIGSDTPGKRELDTEILRQAFLVVDDAHQAQLYGEQNVPLKTGELEHALVTTELHKVLASEWRRPLTQRITVFDATGLASHDLAFMRWAYETRLPNLHTWRS